MPKIPWTPAPRPPRNKTVYEPPTMPCATCLGEGKLWLVNPDNSRGDERECHICAGTGKQLVVFLPAPPSGDLHADGSSIPWGGGGLSPECEYQRCPDAQGGRHRHSGNGEVVWIEQL